MNGVYKEKLKCGGELVICSNNLSIELFMKSEELFTNNDSERVLIIGNGFDISLGLNTRYSDFAKSAFWPFNKNDEYFHAYLNDKYQTETWFDLEQLLGGYEKSMGKSRPIVFNGSDYYPNDRTDMINYIKLCDALKDYLKGEQMSELNDKTLAAVILKSIISNGYFKKIVSFNYTDLKKLGAKVGIEMDTANVEYIHGNLNDGIVLGVPEEVELTEKYDFLYKTSSPNYASHPLPKYLDHASEVVFFGHSLSDNDFFYFEDFFNKQSSIDLSKESGKHITIFTYDKYSRFALLRQLRKHLNKRLPKLYAMNIFEIIKTDGSDSKKIEAFVKRQEDTNIINNIVLD